MLKKFWIPVILCVIVILTGCDQGQTMMKPVATDILVDTMSETREQEEVLTIDFNPEIPKKPTLPDGFTPMPDDEIRHIRKLPTYYNELIFETAEEALEDEVVKDLIQENLDLLEGPCEDSVMAAEYEFLFTNRHERNRFGEVFPEEHFGTDRQDVYIIGSKDVYFRQYIETPGIQCE